MLPLEAKMLPLEAIMLPLEAQCYFWRLNVTFRGPNKSVGWPSHKVLGLASDHVVVPGASVGWASVNSTGWASAPESCSKSIYHSQKP